MRPATTLGRPFKLTVNEALSSFQSWCRFAVPYKVSHIRSINPILLPFYGFTNSTTKEWRVVYGGKEFSNLACSAAKSNPEHWLQFDDKQVKMEDIRVDAWGKSLQEAEMMLKANEILNVAYLPAYEVQFLRISTTYTAIVGAETGRVSGLRMNTVSNSVLQFAKVLFPAMPPNQAQALVLCVAPIGLMAVMHGLFQRIYMPKLALALSRWPFVCDLNFVRLQFVEFDPAAAKLEEEEVYSSNAKENEAYKEYYRQHKENATTTSKLSQAEAFDILQLERSSDLQLSDFRQAYRAQLLKYHPDHFQGDPKLARKKTQQVIEAFRILTNKQM